MNTDTNIVTSAPPIQGIHIPAMRGKQGDRPMYLLLVTNRVLLRNFAAEAEIADQGKKVQRTMDKRHASDIVTYITENTEDYILGAMTYAIDVVGDDHFVPAYSGSEIGTLILPMDAELRCLDGQHRRHAIAEAAREDDRVLDDFSAIVLYVEDDYTKRRQMFSDMNATPKVVSKGLNITFDSRDPYARAAQELASSHPFLRGLVELTKARVTSTDGKIFSLAGVYDGLKRFDLGMVLPRGRSPKNHQPEEIVELGNALFDLIDQALPQFGEMRAEIAALDSVKEQSEAIKAFRRRTLLASTTTLRVITGALHEAMKDDGITDVTKYRKALSKVDFSPTSELFTSEEVNFVGRGGTPSARNQEVYAATKALRDAISLT
ncbi:DNA sulfur modification protein DndB [Nocardioides sp. NPDC127503]|uniref:DNA sulfur modification protein DndB n=1 Tax=Nocardioides sp. NPDC127503 TaxID=3154516 RepID=UPI0033254B17